MADNSDRLKIGKEWIASVEEVLVSIDRCVPRTLDDLKSRLPQDGGIPNSPGVYVISSYEAGAAEDLYVGQAKNLRVRLLKNHLKGPEKNSQFKRYFKRINPDLTDDACRTKIEKLLVRYAVVDEVLLPDRGCRRKAIEAYLTEVLHPKFGPG